MNKNKISTSETKVILANQVHEFWCCKNEECLSYNKPNTCVHPNWYENNGTPVCPDCDRDMRFHHVEINKT